MSGKLSRVGNTRALTAGLGGSELAAAGTYIALLTTAPTDNGLGTELVATGYSRQAVVWHAPTAADPPVVTNNGALTFGPFTVIAGQTVTHAALMDADSSADGGNPDTAANMLAHWALDNPETPAVGDSIVIGDGLLTLSAN